MNGSYFSMILLPTMNCNASCEYCFEMESSHYLSIDELALIVEKVVDYMEQSEVESLTIHWQGGEVMTLPPQWFEKAHEAIEKIARSRGKSISNSIQSNLMSYHAGWNSVLSTMFNSNVGSSLDFPNSHRRMKGDLTANYNNRWAAKSREAKSAGIDIGVISIPSEETLREGAQRFYSYFVEDMGITDFQVNTPFPGGQLNRVKQRLPLDTERLGDFLCDLGGLWLKHGYDKGITVGPFDQLLSWFLHEDADLPCIWGDNCTNSFFCVDPRGHVSQCDCWVSSYPNFRFGNIFACNSLSELFNSNEIRQQFLDRPAELVQHRDCIECNYLAICHGGCPVRAYSTFGRIVEKDPYCDTYKILFQFMEEKASMIAKERCVVSTDKK